MGFGSGTVDPPIRSGTVDPPIELGTVDPPIELDTVDPQSTTVNTHQYSEWTVSSSPRNIYGKRQQRRETRSRFKIDDPGECKPTFVHVSTDHHPVQRMVQHYLIRADTGMLVKGARQLDTSGYRHVSQGCETT